MATELRAWWAALSTVAVLNVIVWLRVARALRRRRTTMPGRVYAARRIQLGLAAVYVLVCGFRSFLPRADVQRIVLVDSFWSSVLVGRTLATIAELCFALQWALFVRELGAATRTASARAIGHVLVPLIVWAELCSWYAVLTCNFLGNAIEQSSWTLCGALIAVAYARVWPRSPGELRGFMLGSALIVAGFVAFMCTVDIPLYYARFRADTLADKVYLHWSVGLRDATTRWIVARDWNAWRDEAAWMALYFSVGVWTSIALSQAPAPRADSA
jgi:hypothetical protein